MIIISAIDDNYGMIFNHRRVSQDKILRQEIIELTKESKLFMNEYSVAQFSDCMQDKINVDEDLMENAGQGDFCFVENEDILPYLEKIEKIFIYKWNRKYPSDFKFPKEILLSFEKKEEREFVGNSHEKISLEIYERIL